MNQERNKILRRSLFLLIPILVFIGAWAFLSLFHSPYAEWLTVEVQRFAVVGRPLDVRITVGKAPEPSLLVVNVYLLGKNRNGVGRLPAPSPPIPAQSGGTYSFRIDVTEREKMAFVQLVIWLSPTGDWRLRTSGAHAEPIPVKRLKGYTGEAAFQRVRTFAIHETRNPEAAFQPGGRPPEPEVYPTSSTPLRLALVVLLTAGGLVCVVRSARRSPVQDQTPDKGEARRLWTVPAVLLFLLALSELFLLEGRLSAWGRKIILDLGLYNLRQPYQKTGLALIAAVISGLLILAFFALRRRRDRLPLVLAWAALAAYLGLSLAGALSFHYVDVARRISFAGISLIDAAKAVCAAAALIAGIIALRPDRPSSTSYRQ